MRLFRKRVVLLGMERESLFRSSRPWQSRLRRGNQWRKSGDSMAEVAKAWHSYLRLSASRGRSVVSSAIICKAGQGRWSAGQDAEKSPIGATDVASGPGATLVPHIPGWGEWMWCRNAPRGLALRLLFATQPGNISCYWPWRWPTPHDVPKTARE